MVNRRPSTNGATSVNPAGCGCSGSGAVVVSGPVPAVVEGVVEGDRGVVDSRSPVASASVTLPVGAPWTGGGGSAAPAGVPEGSGVPDGSGVRWKSRLATYSSRLARDAGRVVRLEGNRGRLLGSSGAPGVRARASIGAAQDC